MPTEADIAVFGYNVSRTAATLQYITKRTYYMSLIFLLHFTLIRN